MKNLTGQFLTSVVFVFSSLVTVSAQLSHVNLPADNCEILSSPAVSSNGTVYISDSTNLFAYTNSGTDLYWTYKIFNGTVASDYPPEYASQSLYGSPAIGPDGTIYVGSLDGNLYAVTPEGGDKWIFNSSNAIVCTPAVATNGTVYFGTVNTAGTGISNAFCALDPADGSPLPGFPVAILPPASPPYSTSSIVGQPVPGYLSSPVIGIGGIVYIVAAWTGDSDQACLVAFLGANCIGFSTNFSEFNIGITYSATPSVGPDGTIYVGTSYSGSGPSPGMLYAFKPLPDASDILETAWSYAMPSYVYNNGENRTNQRSTTTTPILGPTDADGNFLLYVCTDSDEIFAFTCNSSGVVSAQSYAFAGLPPYLPAIDSTPALDAGGNLWVAGISNLFAIPTNNITGGLTWSSSLAIDNFLQNPSFQINSSPVISTDGTLFIGGDNGSYLGVSAEYLYGFDITNGPANTPWPMWRGNQSLNGLSTNLPYPSVLVNIQFAGVDATNKFGRAAIGYTDGDVWNQLETYPAGDSPSLSSCVDSFGNPTSVSVTTTSVDDGGEESDFSTDPLLNGWLTESGGSDWQVSVSLPTGNYDFYMYGAFKDGSSILGTTFSITSGITGVSYYGSYTHSTKTGTYSINTYTDGNQYIVFSNIPVTSGTPIVFNVSSDIQAISQWHADYTTSVNRI